MKKSHAYILFLDIKDFGKLNNEEQLKLNETLFTEVDSILKDIVEDVIDIKTIGDSIIIYFDHQNNCLDIAHKIKALFKSDFFWQKISIPKHGCRIALHRGDVYLLEDNLEHKTAVFGKSITTVARLEPIVRPNEVWCTEAFFLGKQENTIDERFKFKEIGTTELAKNWGKSKVYASYTNDEPIPDDIVREFDEVEFDFPDHVYPHLYLIFVRLRDKHSGTELLKKIFDKDDYALDSIFYIYGDYDVLLRVKSKSVINSNKFNKQLHKTKIIPKLGSGVLIFSVSGIYDSREITLEKNASKKYISYRLNEIHFHKNRYFKAFVYLESTKIEKSTLKPFIKRISKTLKEKNEIVNFYINKNSLIIEIMFKTIDYYELSRLVETIEEYSSEREWHIAKSITFPVHGFESV